MLKITEENHEKGRTAALTRQRDREKKKKKDRGKGKDTDNAKKELRGERVVKERAYSKPY